MAFTTVKSETESSKGSKKPPVAKATPSPEQPFNLVEYFRGVRQEWHKISWPTRVQIIAETGVVLVVTSIFTLFVFAADKIFQFIIQIIT